MPTTIERLKKQRQAEKDKLAKSQALAAAQKAKELEATLKAIFQERVPKPVLKLLGKPMRYFRPASYSNGAGAYVVLPGHAPIRIMVHEKGGPKHEWDCTVDTWCPVYKGGGRYETQETKFAPHDRDYTSKHYGVVSPDGLADVLLEADKKFAEARLFIAQEHVPSPLSQHSNRAVAQLGHTGVWDEVALTLARNLWPEEVDMKDFEVLVRVKAHAANATDAINLAIHSVKGLPVMRADVG